MAQPPTQVDAFTVTPFAGNGDAPEYDVVVRVFAPRVGIPEEPVTGSAQCTLAPCWGQRLGKRELAAYQAPPRGDALRVCVNGDRVAIGGGAGHHGEAR
jgi:predicted PhzF superfamily epimerase YddE/YHI9